MASNRKKAANAAGGAFGAAKAATDNPYLRRLVEDESLRATVQDAYGASRAAYERLANGKGSRTSRLIDDRRLHADLRNAAASLRDAGETLREPKRKKKGGLLRKLVIVGVAGSLALALSEGLRKKALDLMFGAEEEFEYTSTSTPVAPPPAPATPASGGGPAGSSSGSQ